MHQEAGDDLATLACIYRYGKKANIQTLKSVDLQTLLSNDDTKNSLHHIMTARKMSDETSLTLPIDQLQLFEKLSNELNTDELKTILVADSISLKEATFNEQVYVRAKIAIVGHMLAAQ